MRYHERDVLALIVPEEESAAAAAELLEEALEDNVYSWKNQK